MSRSTGTAWSAWRRSCPRRTSTPSNGSSRWPLSLMKEGLPRSKAPRVLKETKGGPPMLYVGLDLSRKRLDWQALAAEGERFDLGAVPPDADGLAKLVRRLGETDVLAVIESMSGARFVHDRLEFLGWDVRIADAFKVRGLAPLACKTDRIDTWVLAELARRDLAAGPGRAWRARAGPLPAALGQAPKRAQEPDPRDPLPARAADVEQRPLRCRRQEAARTAAPAGAVGVDGRGQPRVDRRPRRADHRLRARAARARSGPPLHPAADYLPRHRLGARVHDRGRDRRHQALPESAQARRLHGPLPAGRPVRRARPARAAAQKRTRPASLGADRGRTRRRSLPPALPGIGRAEAGPAGPQARHESRLDRDRPQTERGDLADAHPQPAVRSGRRQGAFGRLTALI